MTCALYRRPARWEAVTNGEHPDAYACSLHLASVLRPITTDGWAKVGPLGQPQP